MAQKTKIRPPMYHSWVAMRRYCGYIRGATPEQAKLYEGIRVCPEWQKYPEFESWGHANGWQQGYHLTRRDKKGDFCPQNCFWAPQAVANGYRSTVRRFKDGRSLRDVIGRENLGRDNAYYQRVAHKVFRNPGT